MGAFSLSIRGKDGLSPAVFAANRECRVPLATVLRYCYNPPSGTTSSRSMSGLWIRLRRPTSGAPTTAAATPACNSVSKVKRGLVDLFCQTEGASFAWEPTGWTIPGFVTLDLPSLY